MPTYVHSPYVIPFVWLYCNSTTHIAYICVNKNILRPNLITFLDCLINMMDNKNIRRHMYLRKCTDMESVWPHSIQF